jgi:hemerythrin
MRLERFKFSEDYIVGVADIDRQHAAFFDIYNGIADRMDIDISWTRMEFRALANHLFMYAKYHFK